MAKVGWSYKKPKRAVDYVPLYFTKKDEFIPKTYAKIYNILTNKKYGICLKEKECQEIRRKSFDNLHKIYSQFNSPRFDDLWNYNIKAITENGLNEFFRIKKLRPFANVIRCFQCETIIQTGRGSFEKKQIISFGINKDLLNDYQSKKEQAEKRGLKFEYPALEPRKKLTKEQVIFGDKTVKIGDYGQVSIARNALFNRFSHWCDLEGITLEEGVLMSINRTLQEYPNKELATIGAYQVVTPLDKKVFVRTDETARIEEKIILSELIRDEAEEIIHMYNTDVDNIGKKKLDIHTYVNNALHLLNSQMPMKYRNQEIYEQIIQTEKMEAENNSIIQQLKREESSKNAKTKKP